jgi:alpha-tubulin suppressor-like RCC1 family protein
MSNGATETETVVYAFGLNDDGQCGADAKDISIYYPQPVRFLTTNRIVSISTGSRHTMCLSSDGHVFSHICCACKLEQLSRCAAS